MRVLNTLLLLFATLAQGVFASPPGWRQFDLDANPAKASHIGVIARCRCCDCGGTACCAVPANPRLPAADQAAPFKAASAPEGPGATADRTVSDPWLAPFSTVDDSIDPTRPHDVLLPGRQLPVFLRGGGLLI
jgi:hypothetical protein